MEKLKKIEGKVPPYIHYEVNSCLFHDGGSEFMALSLRGVSSENV